MVTHFLGFQSLCVALGVGLTFGCTGELGMPPGQIGSAGNGGAGMSGGTSGNPLGGANGVGGGAGFTNGGVSGSGGLGAGGAAGLSGAGAGGVIGVGGAGGIDSGGAGAGGTDGGAAGSAGLSGNGGSVGSGGTTGGAVGSGGTTGGAGSGGTIGGAGSGGTIGGSAGQGGLAGSGGTAGSGGSGGDDDRCDVAVFDQSDPPQMLALDQNYGVHDPAIIEQSGTFYLYSTGGNSGTRIPARTSTNLTTWNNATGALGTTNPSWINAEVMGEGGEQVQNLWAPDLSFFGGQYHLYYSASVFGQKNSCIGHATRASMSSGSWTDHGSVICTSGPWNQQPFYNAIDPNVIVDQDGTPWLFFGSFGAGIKAVRLDQSGDRADNTVHNIAERFVANKAIEAPFVVRRCGYYYLFLSFDVCCQGASSTYNIRVGRSQNVLGPYVDQAGTQLLNGGGTLLVGGNGTYNAAGHNAVIFSGDRAYNVYHAYPNSTAARLRIAEIAWNAQGWPVSAGP